jgi:hypothetical protein
VKKDKEDVTDAEEVDGIGVVASMKSLMRCGYFRSLIRERLDHVTVR